MAVLFASVVTLLPESFWSKIYIPWNHYLFDIHHIFVFLAILNALSLKTSSEAVLLAKPLKSP